MEIANSLFSDDMVRRQYAGGILDSIRGEYFMLRISASGPEIGLPGRWRPAGKPILRRPRLESGRNPARKPDFRPGSSIA